MAEEVHHPKLRQHISTLLTERVMGLDVDVEVPQYYGILILQVCQVLLQVRYVLQVGGREVGADEWGNLFVGGDLTAHHI